MQSKANENGFSLLEVTIALTIITLILGIAFGVLNRFQASYRYEVGYVEAQRNGQLSRALNRWQCIELAIQFIAELHTAMGIRITVRRQQETGCDNVIGVET